MLSVFLLLPNFTVQLDAIVLVKSLRIDVNGNDQSSSMKVVHCIPLESLFFCPSFLLLISGVEIRTKKYM